MWSFLTDVDTSAYKLGELFNGVDLGACRRVSNDSEASASAYMRTDSGDDRCLEAMYEFWSLGCTATTTTDLAQILGVLCGNDSIYWAQSGVPLELGSDAVDRVHT